MNKDSKEVKVSSNKKNSNIYTVLIVLLIVVITVETTLLVINYKQFMLKDSETSEQIPQEPSSTGSESLLPIESKLGQKISLSKEYEEIVFDENIKINFIGTKTDDVENGYKYKAKIYLNGNLLTDNFYIGDNIWSGNYGATIEVFKIENTYIVKSYIAKQCGGGYVLVIDSSTRQMTKYDDVLLDVNVAEKKYTVIQCDGCTAESVCTDTTIELGK